MSEWHKVQPPGPETTGQRPWRLARGPLTRIRSIIYIKDNIIGYDDIFVYILYPCVMSQFYQLFLHENHIIEVPKLVSKVDNR